MGAILIATLVVGIVGLVIGIALVFAGKKFSVMKKEIGSGMIYIFLVIT